MLVLSGKSAENHAYLLVISDDKHLKEGADSLEFQMVNLLNFQWNFCRISVEFLWNFSGISVEFQWNFHGISVAFQHLLSYNSDLFQHLFSGLKV